MNATVPKPSSLESRIRSLRYRIDSLPRLRTLVGLAPEEDIRPEQWTLIETQLIAARGRLLFRIDEAEARRLAGAGTDRELNAELGAVELDLAKAFTFFDTYVDVLTQRRSPELGPLLAGCDALAWDALKRDLEALRGVLRPLVYCDRGFGASFLRDGVPMPDSSPNPLPLIQIPYARLREKHTLTSVLHEAGHEAMNRLGLKRPLAAAAEESVRRAGGPPALAEMVGLWMRELGPDFWTFGASGAAQASGIRELLALPPRDVYKISPGDPHPPPFLRVLLSIDWCRRAWGPGVWDEWEAEWLEFYPPDAAPEPWRDVLTAARKLTPVVTAMLFSTRFGGLEGRTFPEVFNLDTLEPAKLIGRVQGLDAGSPEFRSLRPCEQLSVFRWMREAGRATPERLDESMTRWLAGLSKPARGKGD